MSRDERGDNKDNSDDSDDEEDELFANELTLGMMMKFSESREEEEEEEEEEKRKKRRKLLVLHSFLGKFIPTEIIEHVFKYLSAEDVVNSGKTCKIFREVARRDSIWKRLYFDRWRSEKTTTGSDEEEEEEEEEENKQQQQQQYHHQQSNRKRKRGTKTFRERYFERDEKDLHVALQNVPESQKQIYADVQASKRSEVPDPANDVLIAASVSSAKNVEGAIRFWKERKGFAIASKEEEEERMNHKCGKSWGCSYHRIGGIFLCEKTGREHRCGPRCNARILIDDTYVCGISGITSMTDNGTAIVDEERCTRELAGATADDEFGLENEPNFGERGYILNAFEQGYSCENEKELHDLWWVGYRNGRKSQKRPRKEEEEERYFV